MSSKKQREITQTGKTGNTASPAGPVWLNTGKDGCILAVHAQPGAKLNAVTGIYNDRLKIALSAPPVDGKANAMLIRFIAETAGVPKSAVDVISETSRTKRVRIRGLSAADAAAAFSPKNA